MSDEFDEGVARFDAIKARLSAALDRLEARLDDGDDHAPLSVLLDALKALDELREFVIKDLGTAVGQLRELQTGLGSVGSYVGNQQESINDLSITLAALVDIFVESGVITGDALVKRKAELVEEADADDDDHKLN